LISNNASKQNGLCCTIEQRQQDNFISIQHGHVCSYQYQQLVLFEVQKTGFEIKTFTATAVAQNSEVIRHLYIWFRVFELKRIKSLLGENDDETMSA
jgi:hypothetical protein